MEDYEVRDLFNRADKPELEISVCFCTCINEEEPKYRNMYYEVSLAIPLQTDIEDALVIYRYDTYPTGLRKTNEVMYYKH